MIRFKISVLIIVALMFVLGHAWTVLLLVISLTAHEIAHWGAARLMGAQVYSFNLSALGGVAQVRDLERLRPWQRYVIYGAGPGANLLLAICMYGDFALYNVVLGVFNLLPVFPLDGGRIAQLFLGNRMGILRANSVILRLGRIMGMALLIPGMLQVVLFSYNITLICAGVFVWKKARQLRPALTLEFYRAMEKKHADLDKRLRIKIIFSERENAIRRLGWDFWAVFHIKGEGVVTEEELIRSVLGVIIPSTDAL